MPAEAQRGSIHERLLGLALTWSFSAGHVKILSPGKGRLGLTLGISDLDGRVSIRRALPPCRAACPAHSIGCRRDLRHFLFGIVGDGQSKGLARETFHRGSHNFPRPQGQDIQHGMTHGAARRGLIAAL